MGIPARDLLPGDLVEIEEREGITAEDVAGCGLYEAVEWVEVEPFCGAEEGIKPQRRQDGKGREGEVRFGEGRCREGVGAWGERCAAHRERRVADSPEQ